MNIDLALVLFLVIQAFGLVIAIQWLRDARHPIPRQYPGGVFRFVHREDRAAYARIMRRSQAVAFRDLGRSFERAKRQIVRALLPAMERVAERLREVGR